MYICDVYKSSLRFYCQRYFGIKEIHTFAKEYLLSWFPKHPSYQTFCIRLNMLSEAFKVLVEIMIQSFKPKDYDSLISIVDSMPILTCKGKKHTFPGDDNSDIGFRQRPNRIQKRMRAIPVRKDRTCGQDLQRLLFL